MSKKKRLLTTQFDSCATFLHTGFNIVKTAGYFYDRGKIDMNFDAVLCFDCSLDSTIKTVCDSYDIPNIGIRRYTKFEQNVMLTKAGIMCPNTYDCYEDKNIEVVDMLLRDVHNKTDIVIKPYLGARGIGQVKMKRGDIGEKLYELYDKDSIITKNAIEENDNNKGNPEWLSNNIKNGNYCIQIFEKIIEEYRVLYFYGCKPIIIQRNKSDSTWQSNNGAKPDNSSEYIKSDMKDLFGLDNMLAIDKFFMGLNTPWLSIDLYIDRSGNMGVMEFQMEFGYKNVPVDLLCKNINLSVEKMLKI